MASSPWTDTLIQILRDLWPTMSGTEISSIISRKFGIDVSRSAVIAKAKGLGLSKENEASKPKAAQKPDPRAQRIRQGAVAPPRPISGAPAVSTAKFIPRIADTSPRHLSIGDLTDAVCKYECSGQDDPRLFTFCGQSVAKGRYCREHASLCFLPPPVRKMKRAA